MPAAQRVPSRCLHPGQQQGPTLAFVQRLLGPANAAFSGHLLLGIRDRDPPGSLAGTIIGW